MVGKSSPDPSLTDGTAALGVGVAAGRAHDALVARAMVTADWAVRERWGLSLWTGGTRMVDGSYGISLKRIDRLMRNSGTLV